MQIYFCYIFNFLLWFLIFYIQDAINWISVELHPPPPSRHFFPSALHPESITPVPHHRSPPHSTQPKLLASSMELEAVKKPSTLKTDWGRTVFFFFFVLYCLSLFHSLPTADLHRQNPKHIFLCGNGYKKHLMSSKLSIDLIQIKCPINYVSFFLSSLITSRYTQMYI